MDKLAEIVADKRREIARRRRETPEADLRRAAQARPAPPDFLATLRGAPDGMALIAEIKRRSPSAGSIREPFDPSAIARAYAAGGAQAISVLADEKYFGGGEELFRAVRAATELPLLYKEFVVDAWQIWHAASLGASAALLIAAVLPPAGLRALLALCETAGLTALVEVHDAAELRGLPADLVHCVGVNNRDLRTLRTDLAVTERLAPLVPAGALLVGESGIRTRADVLRLRTAGARAVLVGEHLLRSPDVGAAVRELMGR